MSSRRYFCDICQKGYDKQKELDNHFLSADHHHMKRQMDLRRLMRDSNSRTVVDEVSPMKAIPVDIASSKGRIKSGQSAGTEPRKGFKKAFNKKILDVDIKRGRTIQIQLSKGDKGDGSGSGTNSGSTGTISSSIFGEADTEVKGNLSLNNDDSDDDYEDAYDPRYPLP